MAGYGSPGIDAFVKLSADNQATFNRTQKQLGAIVNRLTQYAPGGVIHGDQTNPVERKEESNVEVTSLAESTYNATENDLSCVFSGITNGIVRKENRNVYISNMDDRFLCTCHDVERNGWCQHLHAVMSAGADAPLLMPIERVMVPIVPNDKIFAQVILEDYKVTGALKARSVRYSISTIVSSSVNLGFIFQGESLLSLREMVIAWFNGKKTDEKIFAQHCLYKRHSHYTTYGAGKKHEVQPFTNAWMIAHTGYCSACTQLASDEVPDV
jgi:hypothetical protein